MRTIADLQTQISGKYSPDNPGIFAFRERIADLGATVTFPASNSIIEYAEGFAITASHECEVPFAETERAFLASIGTSALHIVYNIWGDEEGYVGESTAVETIDAVSHGVPTIWLRQPGRLSPSIGKNLGIFTERLIAHGVWVEPLDQMSDEAVAASLGSVANRMTGVHPWTRKRHTFDAETRVYSYAVEGPEAAHDDGLGPLFANEYELELFHDIKRELYEQYDGAWQRYQHGRAG